MSAAKQVTQIDLLRHGQVDGPAALYGRTDINLSEYGLKQMHRQVQQLEFPDNIISSPLRRCKEFAEEMAVDHRLPLMIEPGFQECNFGAWDGIQFDDKSQQWPLMSSFWQDPSANTPPQGESLHTFHTRVISAWHTLIAQYAEQYSLVVCHGGVIRQILAHLLPVDWQDGQWYSQLNIGYASLTRITIPAFEGAQPIVNFIGLPADFGTDNDN
ncbi:alpha-ribazole phosphatase family protein [Paraglaciecola aquimarina]|uniref:Alpha-ribazole phosphatase family protein n=1 Tax=Paraglaciecola aquimarina TaxID=1235557 RepID=A0ABU3T137_9ALTE|nr:alpha-ribazole phosphatase family protein [Paraglaciecola aquimarina]MDU0355965.1 alpha-ribazole phosphatase family protein [Paraglaciecola aquimarina]